MKQQATVLTERQKDLCLNLFDAGVIKFDFEKGWRLKLQETNPNAPLSPFYIDLRKLQSHLKVKSQAILALTDLVREIEFDYIAGIPLAAVALASSLADQTNKPQITPRMDKKTHGNMRAIDGDYEKGKVVLVLDDLITNADSKLEVIEILENAGLVVKDVATIFDREQGGTEKLAKAGYRLHAILKIKPVLDFYVSSKRITPDQLKRVLDYLDSPLG